MNRRTTPLQRLIAVCAGAALSTSAFAAGPVFADGDEPTPTTEAPAPEPADGESGETGEVDGDTVAVGAPPVPPTDDVAVGAPPVPPAHSSAPQVPPVPPVLPDHSNGTPAVGTNNGVGPQDGVRSNNGVGPVNGSSSNNGVGPENAGAPTPPANEAATVDRSAPEANSGGSSTAVANRPAKRAATAAPIVLVDAVATALDLF